MTRTKSKPRASRPLDLRARGLDANALRQTVGGSQIATTEHDKAMAIIRNLKA